MSLESIDRRAVVGSLATSVALALAGCVGGDDDDADDAGDDNDAEPAEQNVQQFDSPTEFPEGEECAVCNMVTPDHSEYNAQLVKEDGTRVYFCSSGCLLAYYTHPEQFDGEERPLEGVWVTDYETGELLDGQECYYVRVTDSDHVDDIMMMNPTPFADREDADAFVDELNAEFNAGYDHETDVITFDEFDMALAMRYRGRFLNGDHDEDL